MRVFIAEKPELARAIVEGLGGGSKKDGYYECGSDRVTWCFGHMLQLLEPKEYDAKYEKWNTEDLPFSFIPWRKKPSPKSKDQLSKILDLIKGAAEIVNAGDPDPEGQLLVDEVVEHAKYKGKVSRILINDNNTASVKKALAAIRDNKDFAGLSAAAEARQVADQLYGFNLTRAYTNAGRRIGIQQVLSVGRVQTPILGLVVRRDRENAGHEKSYYYTITGSFAFGEMQFPATYRNNAAAGDPLDDKGRLLDAGRAKAIAEAATGKDATIARVDTATKQIPPPLPYNIIKLQMDAAKLFKMKPDKVKDVTQELREKYKLITYNRSDCQYLPEEHHADAAAVIAAIAKTDPEMAEHAAHTDPAIKSRAFDSSKISAHHAIIPTQATADFSKLTADEQKIYRLIARSYIAQFLPPYEYEHTGVVVNCPGVEGMFEFTCENNIMLSPGWKVLFGKEEASDEEDATGDGDVLAAVIFKNLKSNQKGSCTKAAPAKKETKPRPLYTIASLLGDLTKVAEYVKDESLRKVLIDKDKGKAGERGGIGTPATRDTIIKNLFDRGFIEEKKKGKSVNVVSTKEGQEFYDALPDQAKYPDMTAVWHQQQIEIESGNLDIKQFINDIVGFIGGEVERIKKDGLWIKVDGPACPECGKVLIRKKGPKGDFWGCSGYPDCKTTLPDVNGKPGERGATKKDGPTMNCPECGKPMYLRKSARGEFMGCSGYPECKKTLPVKDGKPILNSEKPIVSEAHKCLECGKGLVRRPGKSGGFWWGCSGYPACKKTYPDTDGRPDYGKKD